MAARRDSGAVRLTQLSACAGCAAKVRAEALGVLLARLPRPASKQVLVGFDTRDDAAVFRVSKSLAVVGTVDFFPPMVDVPYDFGQVAAANALSDVWAMGARPLFALNLVGAPKGLPARVLGQMLRGGADKAAEAGVPILGGHTVRTTEPLYGLAVVGSVHPRRVLTNAGARPGDVLLLTKPIGTGIATTAIKRGLASKALTRAVTRQMATLNQAAGEVFASRRFPVHALTDVTGFGLLGHCWELAQAAKVRVAIELERVPLMVGVPALAEAGVVPGGTQTNLDFAKRWARFPKGLPLPIRHVLADAQTSGGLLAAVPGRAVGAALKALEARGVDVWPIGEVRAGTPAVEVL